VGATRLKKGVSLQNRKGGYAMFTHILLATDGSELSRIAIQKGIQLAKAIHARVTGVYVTPEVRYYTYETEIPAEVKEKTAQQYHAVSKKYLAVVETMAKEAGVACDTVAEINDQPHEVIIAVAEARKCDLVVMASHGRRGVKGLLLGSETQKVLTHSKIPVLVIR
jgi:nucleotide-binding universal stress UspA family protein